MNREKRIALAELSKAEKTLFELLLELTDHDFLESCGRSYAHVRKTRQAIEKIKKESLTLAENHIQIFKKPKSKVVLLIEALIEENSKLRAQNQRLRFHDR